MSELKKILENDYESRKHNILGITLENIPQVKTILNRMNNSYPTKISLFLNSSVIENEKELWVSLPKLDFLHLFMGIVHHSEIKNVMFRLYLESQDKEDEFSDCYEVEGILDGDLWKFTKYPLLNYKYDIEVCVKLKDDPSWDYDPRKKFEVVWINLRNFKFKNRHSSFEYKKKALELETCFNQPLYVI